MKAHVKVVSIILAALFSCNSPNSISNKKEWTRGSDKIECLNDSIFSNGNSYSYLINLELQYVDMEIILTNIKFIDTASYYVDSSECRTVPEFIYSTPKSFFFRTGFGMTFRTLYKYSVHDKKVIKTKSSFDDLRTDKTNSVYPFLQLDSLNVLSINGDQDYEISYIGKLKNLNMNEVDTYEVNDDSIFIRFENGESESINWNSLQLK